LPPFISVVVPVRNEERFIAGTLNELLSQDYPKDRFEIVVADGESTDRTREIVAGICRQNPQVRLLDNPRRLSSAGRNIGFKNGKGDIFLVVDGHCHIGHDQLFKNIVACFEKSGAQCLGRPQPLDPPRLSDLQKAVALARASRIGHGGDSLIYSDYEGFVSPVSHGAVYKREVFEKVGYVDESFDVCEDVDFNYRVEKAGFKTYMSPSIAIKYYPRESVAALWRQMVRYGKGRYQFLRKHPETFSVTGLAPVVLVAGLALLPVLGMVHSTFFKLFGLLGGFYLLAVLGSSFAIAFRSGFKYFRYLPMIYLSIHFGLGIGFVSKFVKNIFRQD
jgi:cellulose synthase/poly-beta-1,6-N-acetylglucosamine synthase-like glycosyltransferase